MIVKKLELLQWLQEPILYALIIRRNIIRIKLSTFKALG